MKNNLTKKLVSIALCAMLAVSGILSVNAMTVDGVRASQIVQEKLESERPDEETKILNNGALFTHTFKGYMLVSASYNFVVPIPVSNRYEGYIVENSDQRLPSVYGWLAVNIDTADVLTLEQALENGIIDTDELFELSKYPNEFQPDINFTMYMLGDADNDGELTIKDATEVQRAGIGLAEVVKTGSERDTVFDYDNDGRVSILDVTCIQKKIAGIYE
ncbi:MAG: dockerin type I domain-containing protein [Ruminococcus sp.]